MEKSLREVEVEGRLVVEEEERRGRREEGSEEGKGWEWVWEGRRERGRASCVWGEIRAPEGERRRMSSPSWGEEIMVFVSWEKGIERGKGRGARWRREPSS